MTNFETRRVFTWIFFIILIPTPEVAPRVIWKYIIIICCDTFLKTLVYWLHILGYDFYKIAKNEANFDSKTETKVW